MSSKYSEPEGSSSGIWLYIQLLYGMLHSSVYAVLLVEECSIHDTYHRCIFNRLPEDVSSGSEHVEDIKIKILI